MKIEKLPAFNFCLLISVRYFILLHLVLSIDACRLRAARSGQMTETGRPLENLTGGAFEFDIGDQARPQAGLECHSLHQSAPEDEPH
jgi:hypothetical protein